MTGLLELPGAWMLKIQCCHCWGVGSISGLGSSLCHGCGGQKKKKWQGYFQNLDEHRKGKRKSKATCARILKTPFPFPYNYAVSVTRGGVSAVCHRRAHVGYPAAKTRHAPTTWEDALMTSTKTKTKISENPCDPNYLILEGDMLREVSGSFLECPKRWPIMF